MPGQFQITDDLRAQKAHHIRKLGELVSGEDLLRHRRPTDDMPALEHHDFLARTRQIGRSDQSVVPTTDDDCIVWMICHKLFLTQLLSFSILRLIKGEK